MNGLNELFDAEVFVDTVFSIESGAGSGSGNWFYLADYASMGEFAMDCASWFSDEVSPEYFYTASSGIPDFLISRTWLCPNIFEIRDAIQLLDGDSIGGFSAWCRANGHDLVTEDPLMLVTRYQDYISPACETNPETTETDDCAGAMTAYSLSELGIGGRVEIFDDNYG